MLSPSAEVLTEASHLSQLSTAYLPSYPHWYFDMQCVGQGELAALSFVDK